ncbi:hypothetical protein H4R99_002167 [Coemansia sp. RSA 1722]|nr:hypothetical protein LPJ57_002202 [Coemansia sp. RSA 486]KAJ2234798.1 hypothetical protein IWW45_003112 [Coemansia sp. RSA 485]KAJ2602103.1 hypothetical protein GGF39_000932 [Coemansia sp. RSA 1721]KAJ2603870.1 hypothetical protein H4R99_002167 [Coemansia sp. RSA 1722]
MDEFISTVENQVFALHPLDTQGAFLNVPYHFFYVNSNNTKEFMPFEAIRTSFYKALKQFPILAGYLRPEGDGRTSVVVDRDDLNMPEYKESAENTVHVSALQECNFHHSSWPSGLSTTGAITKAGSDGRIKLVNAHVVRLKDNSGVVVFANIPHYVVDGTGFFSFVELWATLCRAARTEDHGLAETARSQEFCFDRAVIAENLPQGRKPLDSNTTSIYTRFNPLADWLAWLSPATRARLLDGAKLGSDIVAHTFRVSLDSLKELSDQVARHMPDEQAASAPPTHVLAALLSKTVAQAHKKRQQEKGLLSTMLSWMASLAFGKETHQSLNLMADMRHPLGLADKGYMGNGLLPHNTQCPLDILESPTDAESLARVTSIVSRVYENADAQLVGSFIDLISARPSCFTRPMVYLATNPTMVIITNETAFKLYKADFGDGLPEWVCTVPSFVANFVGFLPSPPPSTDITVNITMKKSVMKHILLNDAWRDIATIVY